MTLQDVKNTEILEKAALQLSVEVGISMDALKTKCRKTEYVEARYVFFKAAKMRGFSLSLMGRVFNKDHATALSGIRCFDKFMETSYDFREKYHKMFLDFVSTLPHALKGKYKGFVYLHYGKVINTVLIHNVYKQLQDARYNVYSPFHLFGFNVNKEITKQCISTLVTNCNAFITLDDDQSLESNIASAFGYPFLTKNIINNEETT